MKIVLDQNSVSLDDFDIEKAEKVIEFVHALRSIEVEVEVARMKAQADMASRMAEK